MIKCKRLSREFKLEALCLFEKGDKPTADLAASGKLPFFSVVIPVFLLRLQFSVGQRLL